MEYLDTSQRFLFGNGESRLLGVFGDPIAHSLSPKIHNISLAHLDLNYRYQPFHVRPEQLKEALYGFRALGGVGFNATVPHKVPLLSLMDRLDPAAEKIGAVNTVAIEKNGDLSGYNTDAYGFFTALREQCTESLSQKNILVLGAGGACRAVLVALLDGGAEKITLANRTLQRAEDLAAYFTNYYPQAKIKPIPLDFPKLPLEETDILINTTSLGLHGTDSFPLDIPRLLPQTIIYDIVYSPQGTPLQKMAQEHGLPFIDGLGMLIHQAARAFQIWTGKEMPVELVKKQIFGKR
jgi:shikimate dehydrogenase